MDYLLFVTIRIVQIFLYVLDTAMLLRALLSFLPINEDGVLASFVYGITEPFIMPLRALFEKHGWFEGSPLDMPFFFTYMIIMLGSMLL